MRVPRSEDPLDLRHLEEEKEGGAREQETGEEKEATAEEETEQATEQKTEPATEEEAEPGDGAGDGAFDGGAGMEAEQRQPEQQFCPVNVFSLSSNSSPL